MENNLKYRLIDLIKNVIMSFGNKLFELKLFSRVILKFH